MTLFARILLLGLLLVAAPLHSMASCLGGEGCCMSETAAEDVSACCGACPDAPSSDDDSDDDTRDTEGCTCCDLPLVCTAVVPVDEDVNIAHPNGISVIGRLLDRRPEPVVPPPIDDRA
ncbi:MAG: hypothetical protein AAF726_05110 [Planctomycetota bacterium]